MPHEEPAQKLPTLKNFFKPSPSQLVVNQEKQSRKRKLSNTFQRVSENQAGQLPNSDSSDKIKQKIQPFKMKVERKDTSETRPTLGKNSSKQLLEQKKQKELTELYQQAKHDPFLKRKLNSLVSRDLKAIVGAENKEKEPFNKSIGEILTKQEELGSVISFITEKYVEKNDVSVRSEHKIAKFIQNYRGAYQGNDTSITSLYSQNSINKRLAADFEEEDEQVSKNNQRELGEEITTFRKENFKTRMERIELLKKMAVEQKEKCDGKVTKEGNNSMILRGY